MLSESFEAVKGLSERVMPYHLCCLTWRCMESVIRKMSHQQSMEINRNHSLLACANGLIILGDTKQDTVNSMSNLMRVCKHMGLVVNQEKTKYLFMARRSRSVQDEL